MGRPKQHEPRCKQLNLSLTESELARIAQRAEAVGMLCVHFARTLILDETRKLAPKLQPVSNFDRQIYGQLSRLGNLLNQIVRHLHTTGDPLPPDLELLLKDIRQILARGMRDGS
jgi:hypothetical protein